MIDDWSAATTMNSSMLFWLHPEICGAATASGSPTSRTLVSGQRNASPDSFRQQSAV